MAIKINEITGCQSDASTVHRWLSAVGLVWRRTAPALPIHDPRKEGKMALIHKALEKCSTENPAFYEHEVDIHLNPKISADWPVRGQQKRVVTLGQSEKYSLTGALHCRTGRISHAEQQKLSLILSTRAIKQVQTSSHTIIL